MGRAQPAGHARRQPDVCGPPRGKVAARTAQKSRDAPAIVAKTIVPHPPPHSFKRLLFAPAAGYRYSATGALSVIGARGYYWSSSSYAVGNLNAGDMDFTDVRVVPLGYPNRASALAVRCVQHLQEVVFVRSSCRRCRPFMADGGPFFGDNFSVCRFFPIFVVPNRKAGKCGKI